MIRFENISCNNGFGCIIMSNRDKSYLGYDNLKEYIIKDTSLQSITYLEDRDMVEIKIRGQIIQATPEGLYHQADVCHKGLCLI